MVSLKWHVAIENGYQHAEQRLGGRAVRGAGQADQQAEDDGMYQSLDVLAVINGCHTGNQTEKERQTGRGPHRRCVWIQGYMFRTEDGSLSRSCTDRAECPAAHPAIGDGRRIGMEITVHFVLPFEPLPEGCGSVLVKPDSLPPGCGVCSSDACSCSSLSRLSI